MEPVLIPADEAVEMISAELQRTFPETVFAVRLEDSMLENSEICGVDVIWIDGPSRDRVEDLLDRFQGVSWDPRTGKLDGRIHYVVSPEGQLAQVFYNIDYIFCDGPVTAVFEG